MNVDQIKQNDQIITLNVKKMIWHKRFLAFLIDFFIVLFTYSIYNPRVYFGQNWNSLIFMLIYFLTLETLFDRSYGKLIMGGIVVDSKSMSTPKFSNFVVRNLCRLIPLDILSFISKRPEGWHDKISRTIVVENKDLRNKENHDTFLNIEQCAKWWKRFLGWLIDLVVYILLTTLILFLITESIGREDLILISLLSVFIFIIIRFLQELFIGRTLGKRILGTVVVDSQTLKYASFKKIALRMFLRFLPFESFSLLSVKPYGIRDQYSGTIVIDQNTHVLGETFSFKQIFKNAGLLISPIIEQVELFRKINLGLFRLSLILSFLFPVLFIEFTFPEDIRMSTIGYYKLPSIANYLFVYPLFWLILIVIMWIKEGFTEKKSTLISQFKLAQSIYFILPNFAKNLIHYYKSRLKATFRLVFVLSLISPFFIIELFFPEESKSSHQGYISAPAIGNYIIAYFIYWLFVMILLWVIDGFLINKKIRS